VKTRGISRVQPFIRSSKLKNKNSNNLFLALWQTDIVKNSESALYYFILVHVIVQILALTLATWIGRKCSLFKIWEESSLICQKIFPISISKEWQQNGRLGTVSDFGQNWFTLARFRDRSLSEDKIVMLSEIDLNFAHVWLTHVILIFPTHIQYKKYRLLQLSIEILSNSYFKYYRYFHVYLKDKSIEMESQMKRGYSRRAFQWN
jgi:hypothetical protein